MLNTIFNFFLIYYFCFDVVEIHPFTFWQWLVYVYQIFTKNTLRRYSLVFTAMEWHQLDIIAWDNIDVTEKVPNVGCKNAPAELRREYIEFLTPGKIQASPMTSASVLLMWNYWLGVESDGRKFRRKKIKANFKNFIFQM